MKYISMLSLLCVLLFTQCTPKAGEAVKKTEDLTKDGGLNSNPSATITEAVDNFRSSVPKPGPAPKIQIGTYEQFEMSNGLKVIVVENHKLPRVSFSLTIDRGPIQEEEFAGYADMAGQLMSTGTMTKSKAQIDEEVDFMGATLNTSASGMYAASLRKHTDNLLKMMSEVLMKPSFPSEEFEKIKKQTLSGLAASKDDPNAIASNVGQVLRYGKEHPYGEIITEKTVENITLDKCKAYYNSYFKPNASYLIVVGDITADEAKPMVEKYFGDWKTGNVTKKTYKKPTAPSKTEVNFVNKTGAVQSVIAVTYPLEFIPGSEDAVQARVMNTLLGGFFKSRLNQNLREDKAYTYGARSALRSDEEIGYFSAGGSVRNEVTDSAVMEIIYELNRIRTEKVSDEDLTLVKNYLFGSFARSLESPQTVARFALNTSRYNLSKDYYATYLERLANVTAQDLMNMAQKYIKPENAHILVVGNKAEVAEKLEKIATVKFHDLNGVEVKNEVKIPTGMTAEKVIEGYVNAIGGANKLKSVTSVSMSSKGSMMGQDMTINSNQEVGKSSTVMSLSSMGEMQREVYNSGKGKRVQMGQAMELSQADLNQMKESAVFFGEMTYAERGFKMKLSSIENIEGTNAYAIEVESPTGKKVTEYYSMDNGLKIREVAAEGGQSIVTDLGDYKEVGGVMFPHKVTINGVAPTPLVMVVSDIKVNDKIDPAVFKVD